MESLSLTALGSICEGKQKTSDLTYRIRDGSKAFDDIDCA